MIFRVLRLQDSTEARGIAHNIESMFNQTMKQYGIPVKAGIAKAKNSNVKKLRFKKTDTATDKEVYNAIKNAVN